MKKQDVNKVIKNNKKKRVGINKDIQSAMDGINESDLVNLQQNYRMSYLSRLYLAAVVKEARVELEKEVPDVLWWGKPYPKPILAIEHDIQLTKYKDMRMQELGQKKQLIEKGVTEGQLKEFLDGGGFIKEPKKKTPKKLDYVG